ncbi:hypothetical protein KR51_00015820 [Rubidibacter lacunae KORDI 51-2]|uniref:Sulfatase-modifying factor enzyme-like domain-containing protein n=1 Tax=Rubidibacter lacunae KORDI 51-2 TaxID=582515 RepID=U5DPV5_9CHRO|nr:formylglycine-generating enzyme family protein [Rubidibacter lacunae]ERN41735.1 hypothetical protein KR51_00015820 [Rubidibacter lacunae KORDI 51-2]
MAELNIPGTHRKTHYFPERLRAGLNLDMIEVPGGSFLIGSPETEPERDPHEGPQHEVNVPQFFIGRYPVTQAQWQFVATELPEVNRELDPDPAKFKGSDRPVEQVNWYEAVEFCDRLAAHTGRRYRLPCEAEWEYACRAGTKTPFYFGKTISPELANYNSAYIDGGGPKGEEREGTSPVGHFGNANGFGLSDMHGNVFEWCHDKYRERYEAVVVPSDGDAWGDQEIQDADRMIRGGAWSSYSKQCRSAYRYNSFAGDRLDDVGFRVACTAPRT